MLWSFAGARTARFFAVAAVLLSMSASPTPALATKGVKLITKYPTNERECDEILDKVLDALLIETGGAGLAIQQFLMGTQADKVLPKLCAQHSYEQAADFANSIIDGDPQPPQVKNDNAGRDCFLNC